MNTLKLLLIFVVLMVALIHRKHTQPHHQASAKPAAAQAAVNKEILQNAERLTDTIRKCKQTQEHATK